MFDKVLNIALRYLTTCLRKVINDTSKNITFENVKHHKCRKEF